MVQVVDPLPLRLLVAPYATIALVSGSMLVYLKMVAPQAKPWEISPGFFWFSILLFTCSGSVLSTLLYLSLKRFVVQTLFPDD